MTSLVLENIREIKLFIQKQQYLNGEKKIINLMSDMPHSAVPHNLYGILLEKEHRHVEAMKHFRAAYALDPTYIPARYNLEQYGSYSVFGFSPAYSEEDCIEICRKENDTQFAIEYDEHHVGHMVRKLNGGKKNDR